MLARCRFTILTRSLMLAAAALLGSACNAAAVTIYGTAVNQVVEVGQVGVGSTIPAGSGAHSLDHAAIKYFIPLGGSSSAVYTYGVGSQCGGTGAGTCSDTGNGNPTLNMWLKFSGAGIGTGTLTIKFQDLDLINASDPANFFESLQIFRQDGTTAVTSLITTLAGALWSGNAVSQTLTIAPFALNSDPLYLLLKFRACLKDPNKSSSTPCDGSEYATNTAEYLYAKIDTAAVPLGQSPLLLFGAALGGMLLFARRRNKPAARA
jgi:hypothetical protein